MRVVIKPAVTLILLSVIAVLCFLAFNNAEMSFASRKAPSEASDPAGDSAGDPGNARFRPLDLMRIGKADWAQYGMGASDSAPVAERVVHKAHVPRTIGDLEYVGTPPTAYAGDARAFHWDDGDTIPSVPESRTGLTTSGIGSGFRFEVTPTVGKRQVLRVWVGGTKVRSKLMARMSDGSPLSSVDESYTDLGGNDFRSLYVIVLQASKPEQRVLCSYLLADTKVETKEEGTVSIQAVAID